jgi:ATP-dependent Clp protease ATP-binding subunit ClpX
LVVGPSGSGKTYLLEQCVPDFGISSLFIDASALVPSGYKGNTIPEALDLFFRSSPDASQRCLIVLDEFDKLSPLANGGDTFKSHSLQSELLALIQGKKEGAIDTRHTLWLFAGAFAFADEMKQAVPKLRKTDLLRYGFKNELLGRITTMAMTERPTVEEVVRQVVSDRAIVSLLADLKSAGYEITFTDDAVLELALAAQNPAFGMRVVPSLVMDIKKSVIFRDTGTPFVISGALVKELLQA